MNKQDEVPRELFLRPGGKHPLERIFDQTLSKNALRKVSEEDSARLIIEDPLSLLDWLAYRKPCIPKQSIDNLINETTEPLLLYTLRKELRVEIEKGNLQPVEAVGRVVKLRVQAKGRRCVPVLFMLPCDDKLQKAWKLYYYGVRYWMKYLMVAEVQTEVEDQAETDDQTVEGAHSEVIDQAEVIGQPEADDQPEVINSAGAADEVTEDNQSEVDDQVEPVDSAETGDPVEPDDEAGTEDRVDADDQTRRVNGPWRILHAKIYFRAAIREMIHLSPGILAIGELAYILYEFVKILNSLDIQVHDPKM